MAPRKPIPAPVKCRATAKHSGERCGRWAVPGSSVCKHHGAFGGCGGRTNAEDLHKARRIEAVVSTMAAQAMLAMGYSREAVQMAGGSLPAVRPDAESTPSADLITDEDEENAVNHSLNRMAATLAQRFQQSAMGLAAAQAQAAASRPATISGEVVEAQPEPPVIDRGRVAEDIERLEARPTSKRMAEAARLRHTQEAATAVGAGQAEPEEPDGAWADDLTAWLEVPADA